MIDFKNYEIAEEGFFSDPEVSVNVLMDKLKAGLIAKKTTAEQCDALLEKIQDETVKYNDLIRQMSNAVHEFEAHNMDKEEFLAFMKPLCDDLHNNCTALSLVKCDDDNGCIDNENELAVLREFLVAAAAAVAELKDELVHAPGADSPADKGVIGDDVIGATEALEAMLADDGTDSVIDDPDMDDDDDECDDEECEGMESTGMSMLDEILGNEPAMESEFSVAANYRKSTKAKTAAALFTQAHKLKRLGSEAKAISTMQQAQRIYEALAKDATKVFRTKKAEVIKGSKVSTTGATGLLTGLTASDSNYTREKNATVGSTQFVQTIFYFENCADNCKAYIMKWKNKAEKKSINELKAQLKEERKAERARLKEEAKAAKEAKKAAKAASKATESFDIDSDEALEELALEAALAVMAAEDGFIDPEDA